jgi:hypothetical protein
MGILEGIDTAWIPYFSQTMNRYKKVKHLDIDRHILKDLNTIYKMAIVVPIYTTYNELDNINKKIDIL